jgi:hypothetical protein
VEALRQEVPGAMRRWMAAGAEPVELQLPGGHQVPMGSARAGPRSSVRCGRPRWTSPASEIAAATSTA